MSAHSPEQIRRYLLEHGGRATVPVHNLLTTWMLEEPDAHALGLIGGGLTAAGITVDPPLVPGIDPDDLVALTVAGAPEVGLEPQPAPPLAPPAPAVPDRGEAVEPPQALRRRPPRRDYGLPSDRTASGPTSSGYDTSPEGLPSGYTPPPTSGYGAPPGAGPSHGPAAPPPQAPPPAPSPPSPAPAQYDPGPQTAGPFSGIALRMELSRMRKRHDEDLRAFGGLLFELYRIGSERPELIAERMADLQATSDEILRTEATLGISSGGVCRSCGLYCSDARNCLACGRELSPPPTGVTRRMSVPVVLVGVVMLTAAWLFGGLGNGERDRPQQQGALAAPAAQKGFKSVSAAVRGPNIGVYRSPRAGQPSKTLSNPNIDGARLVFLVKHTRGDWAYVYLPSRPNGSMGWIKLSKVTLSGHDYRLKVDLSKRTIKAWKGSREIVSERIGVGRAVTPTPTGQYYTTELLKQPDPGGTYGPFAIGISAHSDVLFEFAGADGILGIHGTNEPEAIGTDVSHGCIRVYNRVIRKLARTLPVGTPVKIVRT